MAARTDYRVYCSYDAFLRNSGLPRGDEEDKIKAILRDVSTTIETYCRGRHFIPTTKALSLDYQSSYVLDLPDDLLSLTTLTYDSETIDTDDALFYPVSTEWKRRIEMDKSSGSIFMYSNTRQQAITVTGTWGYTDDFEDTGATVNESLTAADTTVTVATADAIEEYWCLLVDTEQLFVTSVNVQANTIDVRRGVNGTTAATHDSATAIYRYMPPNDIERACYIAAMRWRIRGEAAWADRTGTPMTGYTVYGELPAEVKLILAPYVPRAYFGGN